MTQQLLDPLPEPVTEIEQTQPPAPSPLRPVTGRLVLPVIRPEPSPGSPAPTRAWPLQQLGDHGRVAGADGVPAEPGTVPQRGGAHRGP